MDGKNRGGLKEAEKPQASAPPAAAPAAPAAASTAPVTEVKAPEPNFTLVYRREHPQNRCSFGIQGVPGIVVFDNGLFAAGKAPATITMDVEFVQPRGDAKAAREAAAATKLIERAAKAQERLDAQQSKAKERQEKADAALAAAKARVEAAKQVKTA